MQQYLDYLGINAPQLSNFSSTTIICSHQIQLQKFSFQKPWNYLFQKVTEQWKRNEDHVNQYGFIDQNKNCKYIVCSRKLFISNEMEQLYTLIGIQNMDFLIKNFKIFFKQPGTETYIQVTGEPIFNIHKKSYISTKHMKIQREKILYCNHMSRKLGLFKKNFLQKAKLEIQTYLKTKDFDIKFISIKATSNILDKIQQKNSYKNTELIKLREILELLAQNLQKINFISLFNSIAPLPKNYRDMKAQVQKNQQTPQLYDELYSNFTEYSKVISVLKSFLSLVIPQKLLGEENYKRFLLVLNDFIKLKRYEDQTYLDYLSKINVFTIPWLNSFYSEKQKKALITKKRAKILPILEFLFQEIIIPFIRHNFYVTERMKEDWKLYYFRKDLWTLIARLSIKQLITDNFQPITKQQITTPYIGKLRIMPKPGTFRPITTYKRKCKQTKKSLSQKLQETKLVLRNLKSQNLGCSIFDNQQVFQRLEEFNKLWKSQGQQKLYFLAVDITKCYDSIQLENLLDFLKQSKCFSFSYAINKYSMLYRNNRPLSQSLRVKNLFNFIERTCAIPIDDAALMSKGYIENIPNNKPTIIINSYITNCINFFEFIQNIQEVCQNNIVQFRNKFFLQKVGIPQGLNISGVLCSFYLACIEKQFTNQFLNQGLTIRLTDDYLCLSGDKSYIERMQDNFSKMESKFNFKFNSGKTQSNLCAEKDQVKWIGKIIDSRFQIIPAFFNENIQKFTYQVNVNIPKNNKLQYLHNKLKSLILNQLKYFCNGQINTLPTQIRIIRIFIKTGIIKFTPFLKESMKFHFNRKKVFTSNCLVVFQDIFRNIITELTHYCSGICQLDQKYIQNIIRKQILRSIKSDQFLRKTLQYQQI